MKQSKLSLLGIGAGLLLIGTIVGLVVLNDTRSSDKQDQGSDIREVMGYSDGNFLYSCSRPIKARRQSIPVPVGAPAQESYVPIDLDEAKLFCHSNAAIENEGKIKILQRPEVINLINQYPYSQSSIKALEFKYIKDKGLVDRLLPGYRNQEIGCIIIVQTPGKKLVYLEDEKLEAFEQLDYTVFQRYLDKVTPEDRKLFLDNLN